MYLLTIFVVTTNLRAMKSIVQQKLRQKSPPPSLEAEVFLALQLAANRLLDPWTRYLKTEGLTHGQYNVLRILRGARPEALTCGTRTSPGCSTGLTSRAWWSGTGTRRTAARCGPGSLRLA
jgi:hypothetical protein